MVVKAEPSPEALL